MTSGRPAAAAPRCHRRARRRRAASARALDFPAAQSCRRFRRRLLLIRLFARARPSMAHEQAVRLAGELERFLDELHNEEVELHRLEGLVPKSLAEHWQKSLVFLRLLRQGWPAILAEEGRLDVAQQQRLLLDALADKWRRAPPLTPVIAAGVTGTIPSVARVLGVVAGLPDGHVILHALDQGLDALAWEQVVRPSAIRA